MSAMFYSSKTYTEAIPRREFWSIFLKMFLSLQVSFSTAAFIVLTAFLIEIPFFMAVILTNVLME